MLAQLTNLTGGTVPAPTSYASIGWAVVTLVAIITGLNQALKLVDWFKEKPPAGEVRSEALEKFVLKSECAKHMEANTGEHQNLFSKIGGVERGASAKLADEMRTLRQERKEDAAVLQERLMSFEKSIGGLETATELQNQLLAEVRGGLARIAERMPTQTQSHNANDH
jgi:hypothetical protein